MIPNLDPQRSVSLQSPSPRFLRTGHTISSMSLTSLSCEWISLWPGSVCSSPSSPGTEHSMMLPWPLAVGPETISPFTKRLTHLSRDVWSDKAAGQQQPLPASPSKRITKMKAAEARQEAGP